MEQGQEVSFPELTVWAVWVYPRGETSSVDEKAVLVGVYRDSAQAALEGKNVVMKLPKRLRSIAEVVISPEVLGEIDFISGFVTVGDDE